MPSLLEAKKLPVLTKEEERELFLKVRSSDRRISHRARERLIRHNLRLVAKVAYSQRDAQQDFECHFSAGLEGLNRAIDLFDLDRNLKFSTYAYYWIYSAISHSIQDESTKLPYRVPGATWERLWKRNKAIARLGAQGVTLTREALLAELKASDRGNKWTMEHLDLLERAFLTKSSLDAPTREECGSSSRLDFIEVEELPSLDRLQSRLCLQELMQGMSSVEQDLVLSLADGETPSKLAQSMSIPKTEIRKIQAKLQRRAQALYPEAF